MTPTPLLLACLIGLAVPKVGLTQPSITTQPQSQTNVVGTDATFTVAATGTEPLAYQWQFYSSDLEAKTNDTLIVTNVQTAAAGSYAVVVTNVTGAVTSVVATLTVLVPPTITKQPTKQSASLGASATFSALASGTAPRFFQWRFNETNLPGKTGASLVLPNLQLTNAGGYTVVVTNVGGSVTSQVATLTVDPTFTKITSGGIATDSGLFGGSSWADYDNDGFLDLLVSNYGGGGNVLYRNNRDGTFSRINTSPIGTDPEHTIHCAWGDYDNDGFLDLVTLNGAAFYSEANALYRNNGNGIFSRMAVAAVGVLASATGNCHGGAWRDFNNDGLLDLIVVDWAQNVVLYRNNPDGRFTKVVGDPLVNVGSQSVGCAWADFDNDGWSDVFVSGYGGDNFLFRNDGHGAFIRITGRVPASDLQPSDGLAWGDYDNDGFLDLFVTCGPSGNNRLYHNRGNGTFERITSGNIVTDSAESLGSAWGDYDNDGFLDLFVNNGLTGPQNNFLYRNNGDGTFTKITSGSLVNDGGASTGIAWGDYDNDGFLDLFVANGLLGPAQNNFLYRNNANSNNWIKVKCVGTVSNRAGIGAKVRLKAIIGGQTRWQMRQIDGADGSFGGSLEADFGLGDATIIDTLRIEWPSGIVQEFHDVAPKQFLTLTEPARLQARGAGVLRIQSWKGMAFEVQSSTNLNQWLPLTTVTNFTGTLEFTDPDAVNQGSRFYRTVLR